MFCSLCSINNWTICQSLPTDLRPLAGLAHRKVHKLIMPSEGHCSTTRHHFIASFQLTFTKQQNQGSMTGLFFECFRPTECPSHPAPVHFWRFEVMSQLTQKKPPELLQSCLVSPQRRKSFPPDFRPAGPQGGADSCRKLSHQSRFSAHCLGVGRYGGRRNKQASR